MDGLDHPRDRDRIWLDSEAGEVAAFRDLVSRKTDPADWPLASEIRENIPVYKAMEVRNVASDLTARRALMAEWARVLRLGPGVIAITQAIESQDVLASATALFERLIDEEKTSGAGGGDHFAKPGANDRVWNAAQKHCLKDPANFAQYYASDAIAMASEAWLGPGYQVTAQVNRVNPGGAAQTPHRDYHLGFMSVEDATAFPAQCHMASPLLTLQGAVAHCDMPLESGPTMLLPWSQAYFEGYVAFHRPEFQKAFEDHHVQLTLETGDAMFFNPALMHGAGTNRSGDIRRMANLLQVGSAFGRSIESVDRATMAVALYPALMEEAASGRLSEREVHNVVAACAEGYAYPTNLDNDPPAEGKLAPKTQADLMREALGGNASQEAFRAMIEGSEERRRP